MASNLASKDAPMTLGRRQLLEKSRIIFQVSPHEMIFSTTVLDVLDKKHLFVFVDSLLSKLNHEYPTYDTPRPGSWKLTRTDVEEDLNKWNPHNVEPDTPIFIDSKVEKSLGIITITPTTRSGDSWAWAHEMRSFRLPNDMVYELQADSHLLLVLHCQTKVKTSQKKKKIDEAIPTILIPAHYGIAEVLGLVRASAISGIYQGQCPEDLRNDNRSASALG